MQSRKSVKGRDRALLLSFLDPGFACPRFSLSLTLSLFPHQVPVLFVPSKKEERLALYTLYSAAALFFKLTMVWGEGGGGRRSAMERRATGKKQETSKNPPASTSPSQRRRHRSGRLGQLPAVESPRPLRPAAGSARHIERDCVEILRGRSYSVLPAAGRREICRRRCCRSSPSPSPPA